MFCNRVSVQQYVFRTVALSLAVAACMPAYGVFQEFSIGGTTAASIQTTVDNFRAALGNPNNGNAAGPVAGGRREINWDGGGAVVAAPGGTPFTAFQNTRGATMTTPGTGFLQTPLNDVAFTGINPTYATTFNSFSPVRIFTPLGSNITDVDFSLPGTAGAVDATVRGFGAIFSDVDLLNTTTVQLFDSGNNSLGTFNVPPGGPVTAPTGSLSFLGVLAGAGERIARVRITTGNQAPGANDQNGDNADIVVMDDFLYDEPVTVPEPATLLLGGMAALAALTAGRRIRAAG